MYSENTDQMILSRPACTSLVEEDFAPERVIVDLRSGRYYCLNETGAFIWKAVEDGPRSITQICRELARHFDLDDVAAKAEIESFALQLEEANLIGIERSETPEEAPCENSDVAGGASPWIAPTCVSYSELESLLLIDPVHEVDEAMGWPQLKSENQ